MDVEKDRELNHEVTKLVRTVKLLSELLEIPTDSLVLQGPSRHIVVSTGGAGQVVAKFYRDSVKYQTELENLSAFTRINEGTGELFRSVTQSDGQYMGLPYRNPVLDQHGLDPRFQNGNRISISSAIPGELLYNKMLSGTATFNDFLTAAVQIARIQEEGKINKEVLSLEDVVRNGGTFSPHSSYFSKRFMEVFLGQVIGYGNLNLPETLQQEIISDWETLVAEPLVKAHRKGFTGYYFDGNPKHHILNPTDNSIVSFDFEDRFYTPSLLSFASLLSPGLTKGGSPYLSDSQKIKILDRALLEVEFVRALNHGAADIASRISAYVKERATSNDFDLVGSEPNEFYRFLGEGDSGIGQVTREKFLSAWPYAVLDRSSAWIGHKARYRAVAQRLKEQVQGIQFVIKDPIQQNTIEQQQHLDQIIQILDDLKGTGPKERRDAATRLYNRFQEIKSQPYFNLNR